MYEKSYFQQIIVSGFVQVITHISDRRADGSTSLKAASSLIRESEIPADIKISESLSYLKVTLGNSQAMMSVPRDVCVTCTETKQRHAKKKAVQVKTKYDQKNQ